MPGSFGYVRRNPAKTDDSEPEEISDSEHVPQRKRADPVARIVHSDANQSSDPPDTSTRVTAGVIGDKARQVNAQNYYENCTVHITNSQPPTVTAELNKPQIPQSIHARLNPGSVSSSSSANSTQPPVEPERIRDATARGILDNLRRETLKRGVQIPVTNAHSVGFLYELTRSLERCREFKLYARVDESESLLVLRSDRQITDNDNYYHWEMPLLVDAGPVQPILVPTSLLQYSIRTGIRLPPVRNIDASSSTTSGSGGSRDQQHPFRSALVLSSSGEIGSCDHRRRRYGSTDLESVDTAHSVQTDTFRRLGFDISSRSVNSSQQTRQQVISAMRADFRRQASLTALCWNGYGWKGTGIASRVVAITCSFHAVICCRFG